MCSLAGIIKELKGGGGELTAHGVLGGSFCWNEVLPILVMQS